MAWSFSISIVILEPSKLNIFEANCIMLRRYRSNQQLFFCKITHDDILELTHQRPKTVIGGGAKIYSVKLCPLCT